MNELAKLLPLIFTGQECRITDHNGNPWFVVKDVCGILDLKNPSKAVKDFPLDEKSTIVCGITSSYTTYRQCDITSKHATSGKSRARKTQKYLIINEAGVMRLIQKSRKSNAWVFKERIIQLVKDYGFKGLAWAVLPKNRTYRGKELTWGQWVNKKPVDCEYEAGFIEKIPKEPG